MIKPAIVAAVLLLPLTSHAQIYKCEANGRTTFQDVPCGDRSGSVRRDSLSTYQAPPTHRRPLQGSSPQRSRQSQQSSNVPQPNYLDRINQTNNITRARARGHLAIGMTRNQATQVLGNPHRTSRRTYGDNVCDVFYWNNPRFSPGRHIATICEGEVVRYSGPAN